MRRPRPPALREVVYRLRPRRPGVAPTQLPLVLAAAAPSATIETTVAHLDDDGMVWRTLTVRGPPSAISAALAAFAAYDPSHLLEKEVLGASAGRLVLWYKYKPRTRAGPSHTALAFRLLGRDAVVTDRTRGGEIVVRLLARAGPGLTEFLRRVRATPDADVAVLYTGPPREPAPASLTPREVETLRAATRLGYYGEPRRSGVRDVGRELGLSASAAAYRMRRAEAKLVQAFLGTV